MNEWMNEINDASQAAFYYYYYHASILAGIYVHITDYPDRTISNTD